MTDKKPIYFWIKENESTLREILGPRVLFAVKAMAGKEGLHKPVTKEWFDRFTDKVVQLFKMADELVGMPEETMHIKETLKIRGREFQVTLEQDEDKAFKATCEELPAAVTGGKTHHQALANIREAIELCLDSGDIPNETHS